MLRPTLVRLTVESSCSLLFRLISRSPLTSRSGVSPTRMPAPIRNAPLLPQMTGPGGQASPYEVLPPPSLRWAQALLPRKRLYSTEAERVRTLTSTLPGSVLADTKAPSPSSEKLYGSQTPTRPTPPNVEPSFDTESND